MIEKHLLVLRLDENGSTSDYFSEDAVQNSHRFHENDVHFATFMVWSKGLQVTALMFAFRIVQV